MVSAQPPWCISVSLKVMLLCVALPATQKTLWKPIWAARALGLSYICRNTIWITFQTTSIGGLDSGCRKFGVFFCCPDFLKSIWTQSWYAQKMYLGWQSQKNTALDTGPRFYLDLSSSVLDKVWRYARNVCTIGWGIKQHMAHGGYLFTNPVCFTLLLWPHCHSNLQDEDPRWERIHRRRKE